jgi:hypothetical protein
MSQNAVEEIRDAEKAKFLFPLSTRLQMGQEPELTEEALIRAAGPGAEKLLPDGKMRRGKWTNEEEVYANHLIENFHDGLIVNATSGITLRSLLADKLLCDPMRISKKFAGDFCVGKQVYAPAGSLQNAPKRTDEDLKERAKILETTRMNFFMKVKNQWQKAHSSKKISSKKRAADCQVVKEDSFTELSTYANDTKATISTKRPAKKKRHASLSENSIALFDLSKIGSVDNDLNRSTKPAHRGKTCKTKEEPLQAANTSVIKSSESVLCLQSYIGGHDLSVDTTMFQPEKEEEILGVQF